MLFEDRPVKFSRFPLSIHPRDEMIIEGLREPRFLEGGYQLELCVVHCPTPPFRCVIDSKSKSRLPRFLICPEGEPLEPYM